MAGRSTTSACSATVRRSGSSSAAAGAKACCRRSRRCPPTSRRQRWPTTAPFAASSRRSARPAHSRSRPRARAGARRCRRSTRSRSRAGSTRRASPRRPCAGTSTTAAATTTAPAAPRSRRGPACTTSRAGTAFALPATSCAPGDGAEGVLTWPEGNAWLAERLAAPLGERFHPGRVALAVDEGRDDVAVDVWNADLAQRERWVAKRVVLATPLFVSARLLAAPPPALIRGDAGAAPLALDRRQPAAGRGTRRSARRGARHGTTCSTAAARSRLRRCHAPGDAPVRRPDRSHRLRRARRRQR